jgi:hypothetical protein
MPKDQLLNDNAARDFPFLKGTSFTPFSSVVACGFTLGPGSGFVAGEHNVFMTKVMRRNGRLWFFFTSDAPGVIGKYLIFSRSEEDPRYTLEYVDLVDEDPELDSISDSFSAVNEAGCDFSDMFGGFLVTGPLGELIDLIPDEDKLFGLSTVEPALLQSLVGAYGRSINVANSDRTRYEPPEGCSGVSWNDEPQPTYTRSTCLTGPIVFVPGYNSIILQSQQENSLTFSASVAAGEGEPCEQIALFEGESAPDDSQFLEGGPGCQEVVRSINGVGGPVAFMAAGQGVSIGFDPAEHEISVNVDLHNMLTCGHEFLTADLANDECFHRTSVSLVLPRFTASGIGGHGIRVTGTGSPSSHNLHSFRNW